MRVGAKNLHREVFKTVTRCNYFFGSSGLSLFHHERGKSNAKETVIHHFDSFMQLLAHSFLHHMACHHV